MHGFNHITLVHPRNVAGALAAAAVAAAVVTSAGCAARTEPADAPLPPRDRMAYDAETTVRMAVASRLEAERAALAEALAGPPTAPATRPATVAVPAPQLIPAPAAAPSLDQGPSAHPVEEALATVADANGRATRSPTPGGFLNAVHYYDYAPGLRYNAVAAVGYITTVRLRPGERLLSLSCSDTSGYDIEQVQEGTGPAAATLILVKPRHAGTQSNWVLTTDERTYLVDLYVNAEPNFQSMIAWHYPLDGLRVLGERREAGRLRFKTGVTDGVPLPGLPPAPPDANAQAAGGPASAAGPLGMDLADLNFGYVLLYQSRGPDGRTRDADPPAWAPLRVFDDGRKTFVQFPPSARHRELPPVFALDHPDSEDAELVNYRRSGDFLVLDRLIVAAEMRAGDAPQQVVKIVRGKAADPGVAAVVEDAQPDPQVVARPAEKRRPLAGYLYVEEED